MLGELLAGQRGPRVALDRVPHGSARRPPGRAPAASPPARPRGRPSACSPSGRGRRRRSRAGRSIHSALSTWNSTLPIPSSAARSRAPSSIASAWSVMSTRRTGATSSAASKPVSPSPAASSSTRSPGCGATASTIQCDTGRREASISAPAGGASRRRRFPILEARLRGSPRSRSSSPAPCATASPNGSAAAARRRQRDPLRAPCMGRAPRAVGAQLLRASRRAARAAEHDDRADRLAPARVRGPEHAPPRARAGGPPTPPRPPPARRSRRR